MSLTALLTVPDQTRGDAVGKGNEGETEDGDAGDTGHKIRSDVHVIGLVVGVDGQEAEISEDPKCAPVHSHHDGDERAVRDLQQGRLERVKPETLDDERSKVRGSTVGHVGEEAQEEVQVRLEVLGPLDDLVPAQLVLLDRVVVVPLAAHDDHGLAAGQAPAGVWRVGDDNAHDDGPESAGGAAVSTADVAGGDGELTR